MFIKKSVRSSAAWIGAALNLGRGVLAFVVLAGLVLGGLTLQPAEPVAAADAADSSLAEDLSAAGISAGDWEAVQAEITRASYQFTRWEDLGAWAPNAQQGFDLYLGADALRFKADSQDFSLGLQGWGDVLLGQDVWQTNLNQASRSQMGVTETVENTPEGLVYQTWIARPPQSGESVLTYSIEGSLTPVLMGQTLALQNTAGQTVLQLGSLKVVDGLGQSIPASFSLAADTLVLRIDLSQGDSYPLTVNLRVLSQTTKVMASDGATNDHFGNHIAVDGDVLVVSAPGEDTAGTDIGAVYVFHRMEGGGDAWGQVQKLFPSSFSKGYGISVDVSGDVIVVGAHLENSSTPYAWEGGVVYVYQRMQGGIDNWGLVKKLISSDLQSYDSFGRSVSVSGDVIVVGARGEDNGPSNSGAAYVFHRNQGGDNNWGQVQKLVDPSPFGGRYFGSAVAVDGDTIVIGVPGYGAFSHGAIYIFEQTSGTSWSYLRMRTASSILNFDQFGSAVDIEGDVIVVGTYRNEGSGGAQVGRTYVFHRMEGGDDNWGQVKLLTASDSANSDRFGYTVAISGNTIVVGAFSNDTSAANAGAAYVFTRNKGGVDNWGQVIKLTSSDISEGDQFGIAVAIYGEVVAVGARYDDDRGGEAGAAYVFQNDDADWQEVNINTPSGAADNDNFATSVAVYGDVIAVGAPGAGLGGAVFIIQRMEGGDDNWGEVIIITGSDTALGDSFGGAVALCGNTLVVGAEGEDPGSTNAGAAYVFYRNEGGVDNWGQIAKLTASTGNDFDNFGVSVDVSGDVIVVGAENADGGGAAFVYQRNEGGIDSWGESRILVSSDLESGDNFGVSVAVSGDVIVVGASQEDTAASNAGAAYIFQRMQGGSDNWGQVDKLRPFGSGHTDDFFGAAVDVDGDVVVIGAWGDDAYGTNAGLGYIYHRMEDGGDSWGLVWTVSPSPNPSQDSRFGRSVAVYGDTVVIGGYRENVSAADDGAVAVYQRLNGGVDAYGQIALLSASDGQASDYFGWAVAIWADMIVVGAHNAELGAVTNAGAAYIFQPNLTEADLSISKSASPNPVRPGQTLTYTLSVENQGPDTATDLTVVDDLPAGVTFQNASGDGWACSESSGTVTCTRASLAMGAAPDITITVLAPSTTGSITNTASVSSPFAADPDPSDDSDSVQTTVRGQADLSLSKSDSPDSVRPGQTLTYTLSVNNAGPDTAESLQVSDVLPGGVTYQSASGDGWSCSHSGGIVICTRSSLAVGAAPDITITVTAPSAVGDITNSAQVSSSSTDNNTGNNTDTEQTTVAYQADLNLTKSASPTTLDPRETITYTLSVSNAGPDAATDLTVVDDLPPGMIFQSAVGDGWSCSHSSGTVTCTRASLAVGAVPDITIIVTASGIGGHYTNTATVSASTGDANTGDNSDSAVVTVNLSSDLSSSVVDYDDPVLPGAAISYRVDLYNAGPNIANDITLVVTLPAGVTNIFAFGIGWSCDIVDTTVTCTRDTAFVGGGFPHVGLDMNAPTTDGVYTVTATVSSPAIDVDPSNNTSSEDTTVAGHADLRLTKTASVDPVDPAAALSYTLQVNNDGPNTASSVTVTDTLPAGVTYQNAVGDGWSCSHSSGTVTCTRASLAVGAAPDITLTVTSPSAGGDITNAASVAAATTDPDTGNNSDSVVVTVNPAADLTVSKAASSGAVQVNATLTYTLTVTNLGGDPAQDVVVTDVLPAGVAFQSASGDGWACSESGGTLTCTRASLAVGAAPDITITVTAPSTEGDVVNTASVSASTHDPASGNNSDMVTVSVSDLLYFFIPLIIK